MGCVRWKIDDLFIYRAIAQGGSVTLAARKLGQPKSTVSKALARLEHDLGLRLIERSSRRLHVTPEGEALLEQAQSILELAEQTDARMQGLRAEPAGTVRLAVPAAFCREILAPRLADFHTRFPRIALDVVVTTARPDVARGDCDLAVVVGVQSDSLLMQQTLLSGRLVWVAGADYCDAHAIGSDSTEDFSRVRVCETRYASEPLALHIRGTAHTFTPGPELIRLDDPLSVREAVRTGLGVSFLPERYCAQAIADGTLREVWRQVRIDRAAARLAVLYAGGRLLSPRLRAVLDFLVATCRPGSRAKPLTAGA